jgi:peptidyl-prolyl cis-trans isomerase C
MIFLWATCVFAGDVDSKAVSQGGVTVTLQDVDAYMARIPSDKWAGFISSPERIEQVLRDILRNKQLAAQAVTMKLDQNASAQAQIEQARTDVLARLRMQALDKSIKVPDLEQLAKEDYLAHKDQYVVPANVTVEHILISTNDRSVDDALKLAEQVRAKAIANPDSFEDLVKEYSDDPSKRTNNGKMRDATSDKYVPEFSKAAARLTAQHPISEPVKTKFGFHIIKLMSATAAKQKTFDEVKDSIVEHLREQYIDDQKKQFLSNLAAQPMTPYPDVIASLHGRYFTATGEPVAQPQPLPQPPTAASGTAPTH